jgi:uncharacterized protein
MTTPLIIEQTMFGSCGEHDLQERYGNRKRAEAFYKNQMLSYLNPQMRTFIARQEMFFLSTADGHGECDVSFRAGEAGFVHVLDEKNLVYPEYRGNGVTASLGNIVENSHAGLLFVDFMGDKVGRHVNGVPGSSRTRSCWRAPISPQPCEQISLRPAGAGPSGGC